MKQRIFMCFPSLSVSPGLLLAGAWMVCNFLFLAGCAAGPNFQRPIAPKIKRYVEHPLPKSTVSAPTLGGQIQYFKINQKIPAQWWTVFESNTLDRLIREALKANPDMRAASASLQMAHEASKISRTAFFPLLTGNLAPTNQRTAGVLASNLSSNAYLYSLTTASLSVSYLPDVFGVTRRQVESTEALEEVARYQYEAVYLTLSSNVVLNAIQEASLRAQISTTKKIVKILRKLSRILKQQHQLGSIGIEPVAEQQALLAQIEASLPGLRLELAENRHLLASLLGRYSSENLDFAFSLKDFVLPQELPFSLPSELIDNRPDIRAAEATMHSASALIGVAIANRLPSIPLTATGGFMPVKEALSSIPSFLSQLPLGPTGFWGIGANLVATIFDAGSLYFKQRAAVAAYDVSVAQYKRVVLNAFESVADTLKALEMDAIALKHTKEQVDAAKVGFEAVIRKRHLGSVPYLDLLVAEKAYATALLSLVQSQTARFADTVALFQALGGGWALKTPGKKDDFISELTGQG